MLANYSEAIPDARQYTIIAHIGHGKGTRPNDASCFGTRQPHVLFHINACDEPEHNLRSAALDGWTDERSRRDGAGVEACICEFHGQGRRPTRKLWGKLGQAAGVEEKRG